MAMKPDDTMKRVDARSAALLTSFTRGVDDAQRADVEVMSQYVAARIHAQFMADQITRHAPHLVIALDARIARLLVEMHMEAGR